MPKRLLIILFSLILTGCSGSLKSSWKDFRAYYNTFHNAKKYYRAGLQKVENQPRELNPDRPVRVHTPPVNAGGEDFQTAITRGAKILRDFPATKWADDALLLIGRAYYHRREFHPALEKFEELYRIAESDRMKQEAVIWKGKVLLDLGEHEDGIEFLRQERETASANRSFSLPAEAKVLEAEHHALLNRPKPAADLLSSALGELTDKKILGRAYFLFGQMLEKEKRYGEAYYAYSQVSENFPGFEYTYWAVVKQTEVAGMVGNYDVALSLLNQLRNDNKNFDRRDDLTFRMGRIHEMRGEVERAEEIYLALLSSGRSEPSNVLRSSIYFRLGKIESETREQYDLAEAYFDSASSLSTGEMSREEEIKTLARDYSRYSRLKSQIRRADSLLRLASLSPEKLDSVLQNIRAEKRRQSEERRAGESETLLNVDPDRPGEPQTPSDSSLYGFLNYRNSSLVQEARREFQLVWGRRPLVDNWRRREAVEKQSVTRNGISGAPPENTETVQQKSDSGLNKIPLTGEQREELERQILNAEYELGNLFFINLDRPDSARHYYRQVIRRGESGNRLVPRAMYSLFESYYVENNRDSLRYWGERIRKEYGDSQFAARVRNRLDLPGRPDTDNAAALKRRYQRITEGEGPGSAARLRTLALANRSSEPAPHIHFRAIEKYIEAAKEEERRNTIPPPDSGAISADDLHSAYWDTVHVVLQEYRSVFGDGPHRQRVSLLLKALEERQNR